MKCYVCNKSLLKINSSNSNTAFDSNTTFICNNDNCETPIAYKIYLEFDSNGNSIQYYFPFSNGGRRMYLSSYKDNGHPKTILSELDSMYGNKILITMDTMINIRQNDDYVEFAHKLFKKIIKLIVFS